MEMRDEKREIEKNAAREMCCPKCGQGYTDRGFELVEIIGQRGVFAAQCLHCNTSNLITTSVRSFRQRIAERDKQVRKVPIAKVSPTDVVEMKSFLDGFTGDLDEMLGKEKQKKEAPKKQEIKPEDAA